MLPVFLAEGAGADEGHELAGLAVLFAQFFGGAAGEFGDGFDQVIEFGHGLAEGSCAGNLLFVGRDVVEREAGGAIEFAHGLGQQDGPAALDGDRVRLGQVVGGEDARLVELGAELAIHALDVAHLGGLQQGYALAVADGAQVADLSMVGGVTAGLALGALGDVVCHLGQGLGGGDADTGWDARIPHAIALDANEEGGWRWRTSWLMSSMRSTWWSSAGEGIRTPAPGTGLLTTQCNRSSAKGR